jgi:hypothetical protein
VVVSATTIVLSLEITTGDFLTSGDLQEYIKMKLTAIRAENVKHFILSNGFIGIKVRAGIMINPYIITYKSYIIYIFPDSSPSL